MTFLFLALLLAFQAQHPTKVRSFVSKQDVPGVSDSIAETEVADQDVVTCASADDDKGPDKGVCILDFGTSRKTLDPRKSVTIKGAGHLRLTCGRRGERSCHIVVITGFPK